MCFFSQLYSSYRFFLDSNLLESAHLPALGRFLHTSRNWVACCWQLQRPMKTKDTSKHKEGKNLLLEGERPFMSSNFRVCKGVQNHPKNIGRYRLKIVGLGRWESRKSSKIVGRHLWTFPSPTSHYRNLLTGFIKVDFMIMASFCIGNKLYWANLKLQLKQLNAFFCLLDNKMISNGLWLLTFGNLLYLIWWSLRIVHLNRQ